MEMNAPVRVFQTDNGGELVNAEFDEYLGLHGISRRLTVPMTRSSNGAVERVQATLLNMARSSLAGSNLPLRCCAEAIDYSCYTYHRGGHSALGCHTPMEMWTAHVPNISRLRVFGCWAYAKINSHLSKLADRSRKCVFVGYGTASEG